jgi:hypothetical protein
MNQAPFFSPTSSANSQLIYKDCDSNLPIASPIDGCKATLALPRLLVDAVTIGRTDVYERGSAVAPRPVAGGGIAAQATGTLGYSIIPLWLVPPARDCGTARSACICVVVQSRSRDSGACKSTESCTVERLARRKIHSKIWSLPPGDSLYPRDVGMQSFYSSAAAFPCVQSTVNAAFPPRCCGAVRLSTSHNAQRTLDPPLFEGCVIGLQLPHWKRWSSLPIIRY